MKGYYAPVADRKNLAVLANAYVTEIVTKQDEDGKLVATGVKFLHGERQNVYDVSASKEVCLCAGWAVSCTLWYADTDQIDVAGLSSHPR